MTIFLRRELLVWPNADVEVCVPAYNTVILVTRLSHPTLTVPLRTMAVLGDLCDFSYEIHRYPYRKRGQITS
jgi:hypothetical protein